MTLRSGRWLCPGIVTGGLTMLGSACRARVTPVKTPRVGRFRNAPMPSAAAAATARPQAVANSLVRRGPYDFVEPPIAVWTDFAPDHYFPAYVSIKVNRNLAYNAPSFTLDGVGMANNSGGYTDERQGHCYEAGANTLGIRSGYYVGRLVTVTLVIRAAGGQPPGFLSIKVPSRPALKRGATTSVGPDSGGNPFEQYFDLLGCGHVR